MNDMTPAMGHNNPPDPIDEALAPFMDSIEEAANWLDGSLVENEAQMNAVDVLIKDIRKCKTTVEKAKKSATAPLYDAYKAEGDRWKPTEEDILRRLKGLAAAVDPFKRKLAEQKEAEKRAAYEAAEQARREAEDAARKADKLDYDAQLEADQKAAAAIEATKAAAAANKDTVKGLRTVTRYEVTSHKDALHDIARNDRDAVTAFVDEYVRRNHKARAIAGVRVWQDKEAY